MCANRVYLTIDDGPDPEWTPRVLEAPQLIPNLRRHLAAEIA